MSLHSEAAALVASALQGRVEADAPGSLAALLSPASALTISLSLGSSAVRLATPNLLQPPTADAHPSPALRFATEPSIASITAQSGRAHVLRAAERSGQALEDVAELMAGAGCTAFACLPLLAPRGGGGEGDAAAGSCSAQAQPAPASPCLGALTVGFPTAADMTAESLKAALLLARALATEQRQALEGLATTVSSLLLPKEEEPSPAPDGSAAGCSEWASEGEADPEGWEQSGSEGGAGPSTSWQADQPGSSGAGSHGRGLLRRRLGGGEQQLQAGAGSGSGGSGLDGAGGSGRSSRGGRRRRYSLITLSFKNTDEEAAFASRHALHMQRVDFYAYLAVFLFFCMSAFLPGPFFLIQRMGWRCLLGFGSMLPGLMFLTKRTRGWFAAYRDQLLAFTWLYTTLFHSSVQNYLHVLPRDTFRNPLYLQSFGWLTVVGLAFQMRFRYQAPAALLAFASTTSLLPAICATFYEEQPGGRCVALGLLRAALHGVLLPLACCFVFEGAARQLFLTSLVNGARGRPSRRAVDRG